MRTVTFGGANSLDHFIARKDNAVDWLMWSDEAAAITGDLWKSVDTMLMGRKTYEVALVSGGNTQKKRKKKSGGIQTYVFSRTLKPTDHPDVEIIATDPGEFVRKLKSKPGKDICVMGGGELANSLFEADVIDEIGLNIHPVLLGNGVPLFLPMMRQINLELLECKQFKNGCVFVKYRVQR